MRTLLKQFGNAVLHNNMPISTKINMNFAGVIMALITAGAVGVNGLKKQESISDTADLQGRLRFTTSQTVVQVLQGNRDFRNIKAIEVFEGSFKLVSEGGDKDGIKIEKATGEREQILLEINKE